MLLELLTQAGLCDAHPLLLAHWVPSGVVGKQLLQSVDYARVLFFNSRAASGQNTGPVKLLMDACNSSGAEVLDHMAHGRRCTSDDVRDPGGCLSLGTCQKYLTSPKGERFGRAKTGHQLLFLVLAQWA